MYGGKAGKGMSKKLICLAAAVALLFTSLGATVCAAEPEGYDYVIYDNNFEKPKRVQV